MIADNFFGRIVIAGGSGFLGISLATHLVAEGAEVVILSRSPPNVSGPWRYVAWDARTLGLWKDELNGAAAVINLAGRSVNCIKSPDHQDEIIRSRVEATRVLGKAMRRVAAPPPVWVQMSTAHIYGDPPSLVCNEASATGVGFAPTVGKAWEEAFHAARLPTQRGVVLRTSFVIGRDQGAGGGALAHLAWLTRWGLGGKIGGGQQGMSWIHELDMNRLFVRAVSEPTMHGVYIASAPQPVSMLEFMRAMRKTIGMPIGLPSPAWLVRLGAYYVLRTDPELPLYGRYVVSQRLPAEGFVFQFSDLKLALHDLLRKPEPQTSVDQTASSETLCSK
ncbi:TIGR01777 family oxidoreductase [Blastopirellula sp. J2-11]|uniref:TIGR01777 family oxidoreductase n=1 Tax=Blastopirellula sp. J2-11 TaxID=2943192 RepID=UPI0021CA2DB4|nr:TIGR01777 family oxidoreductase [Blastopirellula sp. J2-11]UUO07808.1 TIGR01777 family oxidoreductase [Blastopirellula sp. J2-11]